VSSIFALASLIIILKWRRPNFFAVEVLATVLLVPVALRQQGLAAKQKDPDMVTD
jgi:hypothetical protein